MDIQVCDNAVWSVWKKGRIPHLTRGSGGLQKQPPYMAKKARTWNQSSVRLSSRYGCWVVRRLGAGARLLLRVSKFGQHILHSLIVRHRRLLLLC